LPPFFTGLTDIRIQVFTPAYRKVLERTWSTHPYGPVTLNLTGVSGHPLSNGLYYVVVTAGNDRILLKLLVLR